MEVPGERRASKRNEIVLKVEYESPRDLIADYLTDLSMGGLFICTTAPFDIGQFIRFSLSFPGLLRPVRTAGVVRWRRDAVDSAAADKPRGVGVEFFCSDGDHERFKDLVFRSRCLAEKKRAGWSVPFRVLLVEDNLFVHKLFKANSGFLNG